MQALGRQRLHLAPELLSKCSKAMHLEHNTATLSCSWPTATCTSSRALSCSQVGVHMTLFLRPNQSDMVLLTSDIMLCIP